MVVPVWCTGVQRHVSGRKLFLCFFVAAIGAGRNRVQAVITM